MSCHCDGQGGGGSLMKAIKQIGGFRYNTSKKSKKTSRKGGKLAKKTAKRGGGKKQTCPKSCKCPKSCRCQKCLKKCRKNVTKKRRQTRKR